MQISDTEVKKIISSKQLVADIVEIVERRTKEEDESIVKDVTKSVLQMPDREDRIAELKSRIEAGTYAVSGEEIAESMIRRTIADRIS